MYKIKKIIDRSFIIVHKAFTFSRVVLNIPKQNCRENASKITLNQQNPEIKFQIVEKGPSNKTNGFKQ